MFLLLNSRFKFDGILRAIEIYASAAGSVAFYVSYFKKYTIYWVERKVVENFFTYLKIFY